MFKVGDWVVRTVDGGLIGGLGYVAKVVEVGRTYVDVDKPFLSNPHTSWSVDYTRKATKLELLLNGIDTEQETSYTDNKENDT